VKIKGIKKEIKMRTVEPWDVGKYGFFRDFWEEKIPYQINKHDALPYYPLMFHKRGDHFDKNIPEILYVISIPEEDDRAGGSECKYRSFSLPEDVLAVFLRILKKHGDLDTILAEEDTSSPKEQQEEDEATSNLDDIKEMLAAGRRPSLYD
jgi:hypothetical protein